MKWDVHWTEHCWAASSTVHTSTVYLCKCLGTWWQSVIKAQICIHGKGAKHFSFNGCAGEQQSPAESLYIRSHAGHAAALEQHTPQIRFLNRLRQSHATGHKNMACCLFFRFCIGWENSVFFFFYLCFQDHRKCNPVTSSNYSAWNGWREQIMDRQALMLPQNPFPYHFPISYFQSAGQA